MERNEISRHEVAVFKALHEADRWLTNREIERLAEVAPRTARAHTLKLVQAGIVDQAEVWPAHKFRMSEFAAKRNRGYADRLTRAAEVMGIDLKVA